MTNKFDFNNPTKRPTAIIAAMGAAADQDALATALGASQASPAEPALVAGMTPQQLNAAIAEAALVLPGKQAIREIGQNLADDLDAHLDTALRRALDVGPEVDLLALVAAHVFELVPDGAFTEEGEFIPLHDRGETYVLDGRPILWAGPVTLERTNEGDAVQVRGARKIRHYTPAVA